MACGCLPLLWRRRDAVASPQQDPGLAASGNALGAHSTPALADSSTHPGSLSEPRGWSPSRLSLNEPSRRSGLGRGSRPMLTLRGRSHGGGDLLTVGDNVSGTTAISGLASIVSAAQNQSPLAAVPRQLLGRGQHSLVYLGTWNAAQVVIKYTLVEPTHLNQLGRAPEQSSLPQMAMHPNIVQMFEHRVIQLESSHFDIAASRGAEGSTHTASSRDNLSSISRGLRKSLMAAGPQPADSSDSNLQSGSQASSMQQTPSNPGHPTPVTPSPLRHSSQALQPLTSATLALPPGLAPRTSAALAGADTTKRSQAATCTGDSLDDVGSVSTGLFRRSTSSALKGRTPHWLPGILLALKAKPQQWLSETVMEFCDSGTLRRAVATGRFVAGPGESRRAAVLALVRTAKEIAQAMSYLHKREVVLSTPEARLTPDTVLLRSINLDSRGFIAKVNDLGLLSGAAPVVSLSSRADGASDIQGVHRNDTAAYAAPELMQGHPVPASDVWSFGMLLYFMVTRMEPYKDALYSQTVSSNVDGSVGQPTWPADTYQPIKSLAGLCLSRDLIARPTFERLVTALGKLESRLSAAQSQASSPEGDAPAAGAPRAGPPETLFTSTRGTTSPAKPAGTSSEGSPLYQMEEEGEMELVTLQRRRTSALPAGSQPQPLPTAFRSASVTSLAAIRGAAQQPLPSSWTPQEAHPAPVRGGTLYGAPPPAPASAYSVTTGFGSLRGSTEGRGQVLGTPHPHSASSGTLGRLLEVLAGDVRGGSEPEAQAGPPSFPPLPPAPQPRPQRLRTWPATLEGQEVHDTPASSSSAPRGPQGAVAGVSEGVNVLQAMLAARLSRGSAPRPGSSRGQPGVQHQGVPMHLRAASLPRPPSTLLLEQQLMLLQQQQQQALQVLQQQQQQQQQAVLIQHLSQQLALQQLQSGFDERAGMMGGVGPPSAGLGGLVSNNPQVPRPYPVVPQAFLSPGPGLPSVFSPAIAPGTYSASQTPAEHDTWTSTTAGTVASHLTGSAIGSWALGSLPSPVPAPTSGGSPQLGGFPLFNASTGSGAGIGHSSGLPPPSPWNPALARAQLQAGLRQLPTFSSITSQSSSQSNPPLITSATVGSLMCSATVSYSTSAAATFSIPPGPVPPQVDVVSMMARPVPPLQMPGVGGSSRSLGAALAGLHHIDVSHAVIYRAPSLTPSSRTPSAAASPTLRSASAAAPGIPTADPQQQEQLSGAALPGPTTTITVPAGGHPVGLLTLSELPDTQLLSSGQVGTVQPQDRRQAAPTTGTLGPALALDPISPTTTTSPSPPGPASPISAPAFTTQLPAASEPQLGLGRLGLGPQPGRIIHSISHASGHLVPGAGGSSLSRSDEQRVPAPTSGTMDVPTTVRSTAPEPRTRHAALGHGGVLSEELMEAEMAHYTPPPGRN